MKMSRVIVPAIALCAAAASARADFYTKVDALFNNPADVKVDSASAFRASIKSSLGYSASLGYKFSLVRAELEVQYFNSSASGASNSSSGGLTVSGDYRQFSGFLNGYVDLPSFFGLAPYVGAGVGKAVIDLDQLSAQQGGGNVVQFWGRGVANGYQFMAGLQFHVLGKATANIGYRVMHKGSFETHNFASNLRQDVGAGGFDQMFEIGIAWGF